mgnify:CR=1 FL=1
MVFVGCVNSVAAPSGSPEAVILGLITRSVSSGSVVVGAGVGVMGTGDGVNVGKTSVGCGVAVFIGLGVAVGAGRVGKIVIVGGGGDGAIGGAASAFNKSAVRPNPTAMPAKASPAKPFRAADCIIARRTA